MKTETVINGHTVRTEASEQQILVFFDAYPEAGIVLNRDDQGQWHDPARAEYDLGNTRVASNVEDAIRYCEQAAREETENMP